ncbi:MAG TPA: division/cell wall cluster transcriptional repressor MraZ [Methylomirabilota bacterium]|nr:division/cell wall cluster transcriptional repressor MraZ [Methylomirabilota bacterium]
MFRGNVEHTLDAKGRVSIPAKLRELLLSKGDERLVITNYTIGGSRCLDVYPIEEWIRLEDEIRKKPAFDSRTVVLQNYYLGGASECVIDKQGRILIPPNLREYANLRRDVVLVSALGKFRVWDREIWKKVFAEAEDKLIQDPDLLAGLGL